MKTGCLENRDTYHGYDSPSFSSTLLDAIYRSIDESARDPSRPRFQEEVVLFGEMAVKKQSGVNCSYGGNSSMKTVTKSTSCSERLDCRSRDRIVERLVQKTATSPDDFVARRRSLPPEISLELSNKRPAALNDRRRSLGSLKQKSTSGSSSDSSSGGGFSSSDTDSFYGPKKKKSLKPIRTSVSARPETPRSLAAQLESFSDDILYLKSRRTDQRSAKSDGSVTGKTAKSRAMKLYGDLKRMKQPISPGGKLANFLNSLFSPGGNAKKQRISASMPATVTADAYVGGRWEGPGTKSNCTTTSTPTCSTASSYSRSCLSKTPSSAGRYDGAKRSVRFCPVSIIVDEDLRPCGQKSLSNNEDPTSTTRASSEAAKGGGSAFKMDKIRNAEEAAMDLLRNYRKKWELSEAKEVEMMDDHGGDEEEEDCESCCSSDLFELENLMEIGVDRFCNELPVYETTHVNANRAIASGLIV